MSCRQESDKSFVFRESWVKERPAIGRLLDLQLQIWPEHESFLKRRFAKEGSAFDEEVAELILRIASSPETLAADYRWMCERFVEDELYFRRNGSYRHSKFSEVVRDVYLNRDFASRNMTGLLLSQLWWKNHTDVIHYYARTFLAQNRPDYSHLEVGPGHGLLLYYAANDPRCGTARAWDVSPASLAATAGMLKRLGVKREVRLIEKDLANVDGSDGQFDSIVLSEVCEHLENPKAALEKMRGHLAPGGRMFINIPVNSPAPGHIYLLRTPEEVVELVQSSGFTVIDKRFFPMTGYSEPRARSIGATISCVVIGGVQ